jgi:hypothetical protein
MATTTAAACCAPWAPLADPHRVKIRNLLATSPSRWAWARSPNPWAGASPRSATTPQSSSRPACWTASSAAPGPPPACPVTPWVAWPPPPTSREPAEATQQTDQDTLREQVRARYAAARPSPGP